MHPAAWWTLSLFLIVLGVIGTFVPAIPGPALVFAGMLLGAWIDHFSRIGAITLAVLGLLTVLALAVDIVAGVVGARRVGASRLALIGAAAGGIIGLFFGIIGIVVLPFVGAVAGELLSRPRLASAARVGIGTWLGMAFGALAKAALVFAMLGVFVLAYFVN